MPNYYEESVTLAIDAVNRGEPVKRAASHYGIPRTTLINRIQGQRSRSISHTHLQRLTATQEAKLTSWVLTQGDLSFPLTHA